MAIASFVLGVVGLVLTLAFRAGGIFFGGPLALTGILIGVAARRRRAIEDGPHALAVVGMGLGALGLVAGALWFGLAAASLARHTH
jgi:hypothetical protein